MKSENTGYSELFVLVRYVISAFLVVLPCSFGAIALLFIVLFATGFYAHIEDSLNLKYDSLFILVPMFASLALALLCLFVGFLLYYHKYKRPKANSKFHLALMRVYAEVKTDE